LHNYQIKKALTFPIISLPCCRLPFITIFFY
jgi:hypothetical protein